MKRIARFALAIPFLLLSYFALRFAYADFLFHSGNPANLALAARITPSNPYYQARLGNLHRALELNPYMASVWLELATAAESRADFAEAERCLIAANEVDATFEPRWALANFYFRRDRSDDFWRWLRLAAEHSYGDRAALFQLAWRTGMPASGIERRLTGDLPEVRARYIEWLTKQEKLEEAGHAAIALVESGDRKGMRLATRTVQVLLEKRRVEGARVLWNALVKEGWIRGSTITEDGVQLTNPRLEWKPTGIAFDWVFPWRGGIEHHWQAGRLTIHLDGREEERTELLSQVILARPETEYAFRCRYRTASLAANSGVRWRVFSQDEELEVPVDVLSGSDWKTSNIQFRTKRGMRLLRLVLAYERASGTVRQEGDVVLDGSLQLSVVSPRPAAGLKKDRLY